MKHAVITLPGSGIEIRIRRIPHMAMQRVQIVVEEEMKDSKPKAPTMKVETAPGSFEYIPDENDSKYREELIAWNISLTEHLTEMYWDVILKAGIVYELTDEDKKEIAQLREVFERLQMKLPESDRMFWLRYIAAPTIEDYKTLLWECFGKSSPSEAQVTFHRILFQRKVQEPGSQNIQATERPDNI